MLQGEVSRVSGLLGLQEFSGLRSRVFKVSKVLSVLKVLRVSVEHI